MNKELKVAFVCVENAGRSQMATAFAELEREKRGMDIGILTGGTQPAESVHSNVVEVMRERGMDLEGRTPREITPEELEEVDYVITMGCSAEDVCPVNWSGQNHDWDFDDPKGVNTERTREIRDEIEGRVSEFFDELEREHEMRH